MNATRSDKAPSDWYRLRPGRRGPCTEPKAASDGGIDLCKARRRGRSPPLRRPHSRNAVLLLILLTLIGIGWTSVSRTPTTTYWIVLTPVAALICIAAGWRHCASNAERLRMAASQALHWAAFLLAMILVTVSDVHGLLNFDATALMLLMLLALGVFTAGLSLWSWKLCVTGVFLGLAAPLLAWVERAALLLMLIGAALIAFFVVRWRFRERGRSATAAAGE